MPGLTTTQAPFIEQARSRGQLYISQPYELYTAENHRAWRNLYARILPRWQRYANPAFLQGIQTLRLHQARVPRLDDINGLLEPLTGFQAKPVSGYVPAFLFFDCLSRREFPTTITIRGAGQLDYLPEPDIFHDVAGHVPMHTDPAFADALVRFGKCARAAADFARTIDDPGLRIERLSSIIKALARFFWFTIEFGLMGTGNGLKVYGSGLLSSYGEIAHSIESPDVQRWGFRIEWVINQHFEIDRYQPLLFIIDNFEHLFDLIGQLEMWMLQGRLNYVAPGEPEVSETDLGSFLEAAQ